MFNNKVIVITGASHGIGRCTAEMFASAGAHVCTIDINDSADPKPYFVGDLSDKKALDAFAEKVIAEYGRVDCLINNAPPMMKGITDCSYEEFEKALSVGVTSAFYLTKLFLPYFAPGASVVNLSSSRDRMSQVQTESYTAAKGGIAALTHALAVSLAGKVRVNSISPGWIETNGEVYEGADLSQHPAGRVGTPEDIANMILFLCSDKAGFITGENICIDGGMTRQMIYHNDHGWELHSPLTTAATAVSPEESPTAAVITAPSEEPLTVPAVKTSASKILSFPRTRTPLAYKLHLNLQLKYIVEADRKVLKKYGKMNEGITRDVIVPADITLHALSYVILRCFGWQNSHLHNFRLPHEVFQRMTGGTTEFVGDESQQIRDGSFSRWADLCGIYFRYPTEDFDDLYWDDDYREGQNLKTWMRKKYRGPYGYGGECEHYVDAHANAQNDKMRIDPSATIMEVEQSHFAILDELLERLPLSEILVLQGTQPEKNLEDRLTKLILAQEKADEELPVLPVTDLLMYDYDPGDGWSVEITITDLYYAATDNGEEMSAIASAKNTGDISVAADVIRKRLPACTALDGLNVLDDVGGVSGYVDFLEKIHGDDPDEADELLDWANWMGWTGRKTRPDKIL